MLTTSRYRGDYNSRCAGSGWVPHRVTNFLANIGLLLLGFVQLDCRNHSRLLYTISECSNIVTASISVFFEVLKSVGVIPKQFRPYTLKRVWCCGGQGCYSVKGTGQGYYTQSARINLKSRTVHTRTLTTCMQKERGKEDWRPYGYPSLNFWVWWRINCGLSIPNITALIT